MKDLLKKLKPRNLMWAFNKNKIKSWQFKHAIADIMVSDWRPFSGLTQSIKN